MGNDEPSPWYQEYQEFQLFTYCGCRAWDRHGDWLVDAEWSHNIRWALETIPRYHAQPPSIGNQEGWRREQCRFFTTTLSVPHIFVLFLSARFTVSASCSCRVECFWNNSTVLRCMIGYSTNWMLDMFVTLRCLLLKLTLEPKCGTLNGNINI